MCLSDQLRASVLVGNSGRNVDGTYRNVANTRAIVIESHVAIMCVPHLIGGTGNAKEDSDGGGWKVWPSLENSFRTKPVRVWFGIMSARRTHTYTYTCFRFCATWKAPFETKEYGDEEKEVEKVHSGND